MMNCSEYEILKDVPGYRAILKAVLKSQIQNLVEQLSKETEEETVILSASTTDGTLSQLGSIHGKDFLKDKDDIKFQFLNHCLKKKHSASPHALEDEENQKHSRNSQNFEQIPSNFDSIQARQTEDTAATLWQQTPETISIDPLQNNVTLDDVLQKDQDDYSGVNADFSETLTVNGEKLVVQTNPVRRKRKRKPNFIPNSQRRRVSEANVKVETVPDSFIDTAEPTCSVYEELDQRAGESDIIHIKDEPEDESYLEHSDSLPADDVTIANNNTFQYDTPMTSQEKALLTSFGDEMPNQEPVDGKSLFNLVNEADRLQLNPADIYKAKFRKLLNIKLEEGDRPYKCPLCSRCFKLRHHLQNHFSVHSGERVYECDVCGKSFMRRGTMQIHRRIHTRETPYKCDKCHEAFTRKDRLLYHRCPTRNSWSSEEFPTDLSQSSTTSYVM